MQYVELKVNTAKNLCFARWNTFLSVFGIFIFSRFFCSLLVYWGHSKRPYLEPVLGGWEGVPNWFINPWTTYDSEWYLRIAAHGYEAKTVGFFPLYPWLLQFFGNDQFKMALTGVVISNLSFLIALFLVFRLTELEWNRQVAYITIGVLAFTPAAPFWGAVYTESIFLLLLAATFLAARTDRWWLAGLFGGMAALCRNPGFLLAGALFLEAFQTRKQNSSLGSKLAWLFPLIAFAAVQSWHWLHANNPLAGLPPKEFHRQFGWPWDPITKDIYTLFFVEYDLFFAIILISGLLYTFLGLCIPAICRNKFRASYYIIVTGITLMNLIYSSHTLPHTLSATRYMAPLFPVSQFIAVFLYNSYSAKKNMFVIGIMIVFFMNFCFMFGKKNYLG